MILLLQHTILMHTSFRPLTGISLFLLFWFFCLFSLFYIVFVPSRGFLFFYDIADIICWKKKSAVFVPSRGFLFFYRHTSYRSIYCCVFVPSRGFLFFYEGVDVNSVYPLLFSSPHGDFSFSILMEMIAPVDKKERFRPLTGISLFLCYLLRCF